MSAESIPEKIVQNTLLQAVARIAMAVTLPLMLFGLGYIGAMGNTVNAHSTDIALLQQAAIATDKRMDADDAQSVITIGILNKLQLDTAETKKDVGYLRDWVEDLKRRSVSALAQ